MAKSKRHGPGRLTGRSNKSTGQAKDKIAEVFEMLGGVEGLVTWGRKHPSEFYRKIYPKLIGVVLEAKIEGTVKSEETSAYKALQRIFNGIIAERKAGHDKGPIVTDPDRSGDTASEPAVDRTNGSSTVDKRSG